MSSIAHFRSIENVAHEASRMTASATGAAFDAPFDAPCQRDAIQKVSEK